jgi:hypothetical protein
MYNDEATTQPSRRGGEHDHRRGNRCYRFGVRHQVNAALAQPSSSAGSASSFEKVVQRSWIVAAAEVGRGRTAAVIAQADRRATRLSLRCCTVLDVAGWDPGDERLTVAAHQAAGIVAEQTHCDIREAFRLMIAASAAKGCGVNDTAYDVIGGIIRLGENAPS